MSDGYWDYQYMLANEIKEEIISYCNKNNVEHPQFPEYARTWELENIFKQIKEDNKGVLND